jgi:small subunit ribosomal protein S4
LLEKQFRRVFDKAERMPGVTGANLLILLERRLDNTVYRLGMAATRAQARQIVNHGHIMVNGRKTNIPSFTVRVGDVISVRPESKRRNYFKNLNDSGDLNRRQIPDWLRLDSNTMSGTVVNMPRREDAELNVQESLIVEFYSR